jgi:hypothetical protein
MDVASEVVNGSFETDPLDFALKLREINNVLFSRNREIALGDRLSLATLGHAKPPLRFNSLLARLGGRHPIFAKGAVKHL